MLIFFIFGRGAQVRDIAESSIEILTGLILEIVEITHLSALKTVALPSMATGYGKLEIKDFAQAMKECGLEDDDRIDEMRVVLYHQESYEEFLRSLLIGR